MPSVQLAASAALLPAVSNEGLATPLVAAQAAGGDQPTRIIAADATRAAASANLVLREGRVFRIFSGTDRIIAPTFPSCDSQRFMLALITIYGKTRH